MKFRQQIVQAAAVAGVLASASAFAVDGTITINGMITDTTCNVSVNSGTNSETVTLPTVSASALPSTGSTAGTTPFTIKLADCEGAAEFASTYFEPGIGVDSESGRLTSTGGAGGVQVELLNSDMGSIFAGTVSGSQNDKQVSISSSSATMQYYARYYAISDAVTPGSVVSQVDYTILYQ